LDVYVCLLDSYRCRVVPSIFAVRWLRFVAWVFAVLFRLRSRSWFRSFRVRWLRFAFSVCVLYGLVLRALVGYLRLRYGSLTFVRSAFVPVVPG